MSTEQMCEDLGVALGLPHHLVEGYTWTQLVALVGRVAGELAALRGAQAAPRTKAAALSEAAHKIAGMNERTLTVTKPEED